MPRRTGRIHHPRNKPLAIYRGARIVPGTPGPQVQEHRPGLCRGPGLHTLSRHLPVLHRHRNPTRMPRDDIDHTHPTTDSTNGRGTNNRHPRSRGHRTDRINKPTHRLDVMVLHSSKVSDIHPISCTKRPEVVETDSSHHIPRPRPHGPVSHSLIQLHPRLSRRLRRTRIIRHRLSGLLCQPTRPVIRRLRTPRRPRIRRRGKTIFDQGVHPPVRIRRITITEHDHLRPTSRGRRIRMRHRRCGHPNQACHGHRSTDHHRHTPPTDTHHDATPRIA
ncbi:hypothetical protein CBOVI_10810 (plasmid) [Corynebacterium bovis DSM 20582 = CIP 54.80]|nr:hypothetical protein CBOVI_10810 [Corynebacterium bovis DSM 20582 = CIP 54.80]